MNDRSNFFATAPLGLEYLLLDELAAMGVEDVAIARAGVSFSGTLTKAYQVCLWSRLANRVLLKLSDFPAASPEALYAGISGVNWAEHMDPAASIAVDFVSVRSQITHTRYGAQKAKDAIVDQFRENCGVRPSVDLDHPDIRINIFVDRDIASVSLDLSGESLHRRGYRLEGGVAPLKENLAAAILIRSGWPEIMRDDGDLIDPMCGSGTLPIEAFLMAADIAPGMLRDDFGFRHWKKHEDALWQTLLAEAQVRREMGLERFRGMISGHDVDRRAIGAALANLERAGLAGKVYFEQRRAADVRPRSTKGLLVVNPPYGERLGEEEELRKLYSELGETLKGHFEGWRAGVLTANAELAFRLGVRSRRRYMLHNGALACTLFLFQVEPERYFTPHGDAAEGEVERLWRNARALSLQAPSDGAVMFANRLRKNLKNLGRWARQNAVSCYRLYDADLPEYSLVVDIYQGEKRWLHVQEYEAPSSIDPKKAERRLVDALAMLPGVLEVPPEQIFLKVRRRQKGSAQYEKRGETGHFFQVEEGGCRLWVNFEDYLDTGLFLDHRPTRQLIQQLAGGKRFLNLFAYTGAATVHAAVGGALATTTVDMSRTYLDWATRNLALNGEASDRHEVIQANCLAWMEAEASRGSRSYDLIFLDPPTFSNSKRMDEVLDIQRDHPLMLKLAMRLLADDGLLIFSTNFRKFRLQKDALAGLSIEEISLQTVPKDFERNPKIHYCWKIKKLNPG